VTGRCLVCLPVVDFSTIEEWADHEAGHASAARGRILALIGADPTGDGMKITLRQVDQIISTHDRADRRALGRRWGLNPKYVEDLYYGRKVRVR
jgi:hypothetical protein